MEIARAPTVNPPNVSEKHNQKAVQRMTMDRHAMDSFVLRTIKWFNDDSTGCILFRA